MSIRKKKSVVLMQGLVDPAMVDLLKKRNKKDLVLLEGRASLPATKKILAYMLKKKMSPTIIAANMAGYLFSQNLVKEVWLAYHLSDKNGALCDIGAQILGVLSKRHNVPVYLYPSKQKTRFMAEQNKILNFNGMRIAPQGVVGYAPLVEWLPKRYFSKIIHQIRKVT